MSVVVSDVVGRVLGQLGGSDREEEMAPYFGGIDKLNRARETLSSIRTLAIGLEGRQELQVEKEIPRDVMELMKSVNANGVLYEMEDLLEEVSMVTREERLTKPVCVLASFPGMCKIKNRVSRCLKDRLKDLGDLWDDYRRTNENFAIVLREEELGDDVGIPSQMNRQQYGFFTAEEEIVGRDKDKVVIMERLLDSDPDPGGKSGVSAIAIVGMGGVGKTTLARQVYQDKTISNNFEAKFWVNVAQDFEVNNIVKEMLLLINRGNPPPLSSELLRPRLVKAITDKKFLLVLDDVWNENPDLWLQLWDCIRHGKKGSKILVTTRSHKVTKVMVPHPVLVYELHGLSTEEYMALLSSRVPKEMQGIPDFMLRQIVERCAGFPLAIATILGLVRSKNAQEERKEILHILSSLIMTTSNGDITKILKLSYDHLSVQLKRCFAYCSLFPKDYEISKFDLISLWLAQGYISDTLNGDRQRPEQVGNDYFMELLQRYFFVVAKRNENGEVISCKLHDLMHDLALQVGLDQCISAVEDQHIDIADTKNIIHVSFVVDSSWEPPSWLLAAKQLRSLLLFPSEHDGPVTILNMDKLFSSLRRLRALVLDMADFKHLPSSIARLKHLRYLKLGGLLESLPGSIKRMHYLQTLDLQACGSHVKLPGGFPSFIDVRLSCDWEHYKFVVNESKDLKELVSSLDKLVGKLEINFKKRRTKALSEARDAKLKNIHVNDLVLEWSSSYGEPHSEEDEDKLLQCLQPSQSVQSLAVRFWKGMNFPSWGMNDPSRVNILNLVSLEIEGCSRCQQLPSFSQLPYLKFLLLSDLKCLEYVDANHNGIPLASYFKSLENLKLEELPKLKGWSRGEADIDGQGHQSQQNVLSQQSFPSLSELTIYLCPKLMSMPPVPNLERLSLEDIPTELARHLTSPASSTFNTFKVVQIASVHQLESLSINSSIQRCLKIKRCEKLIDLIVTSRNFPSQLEIYSCCRLRNISGALQHVKELKIWRCEELKLWGMMDEEDSTGVDHVAGSSGSVKSVGWQDLKGLRLLAIGCVMKIESLPKGLDYLTELQELQIFQLCNLRVLPTWIGCLTQLRRLEIVECPNMRTLFNVSAHEPYDFTINLTIKIERCRELLELFAGTAVTFQCLEIHHCPRLKSISSAELEIRELVVNYCEDLHLWEHDEGGSTGEDVKTTAVAAWQGLKSLDTLTLERISKLVSPSKGICCLELLQELKMFQLHMVALPLQIDYLTKLRQLEIIDCSKLETISISPAPATVGEVESVMSVNQNHLTLIIKIERCPELISMAAKSPTTLQNLEIRRCCSMKEISGEELVIQNLVVEDCDELDLWNDQEDSSSSSSSDIVIPATWQALKSLQSLTLSNISKLKSLPRGLQSAELLKELEIIKLSNLSTVPEWIGQLTKLDRLDIRECPKLTVLPDSLSQLTNLRRLLIRGCNPKLKSRCQPPDGQDWPKIQHIPESSVA